MVVGGIAILAFVTLSGWAISAALNHYTQQAEQQRLQGIIYSLLAETEVNEQGQLSLDVDVLPEARLRQPDSGLFATVISEDTRVVWESLSKSVDSATPNLRADVGEWVFQSNHFPALAFGFEWLVDTDSIHSFTLSVVDTNSPLFQQKKIFTQRLWTGLGIAGGVLLLILLTLLSWGLAPLKDVIAQLESIKQGKQDKLKKQVPNEIQPLTQSINNLLHQQTERQERYKNAMGDLAHSLKTPLAVLKGQVDSGSSEQHEQLDRIDQIVSYQLQRASLSSGHALRKEIALAPAVQRTVNALKKVYADKQIAFEMDLQAQTKYGIDEGDWLELCGNLLDNAAKFTQDKVLVSLEQAENSISFTVSDNGAGFPEAAEELFTRGRRADTLAPGQGLGLSMVRDICSIYRATVQLDSLETAGASVTITFPNNPHH